MKLIERNKNHKNDKSHDMSFVEIEGKKIKFTYEAYNASEKFSAQIWSNDEWNLVLTMLDLGILPDSGYYVQDNKVREKKNDELVKKAISLVQKILK